VKNDLQDISEQNSAIKAYNNLEFKYCLSMNNMIAILF